VQRNGTFPLWDGTAFEDTVTTSMVVGQSGAFDYHVNPSTRPFVDSRKAAQLSQPVAEVQTTGQVAPLRTQNIPFEVPEDVDVIRATVSTSVPVDGQAVSYNEMHLRLINPFGAVVAEAKKFGPVNSFLARPEGGLEAGTYTLRVNNTLAATSMFDLEAYAQNVLAPVTNRTEEFWTVTCQTPGGSTASRTIGVDRGQSVDLGSIC
jgi:hypothetical protein